MTAKEREHQQMVQWIIKELGSISPYEDTSLAAQYSTGFLAAWLAQEFQRDPWQRKKFKLLVDRWRT